MKLRRTTSMILTVVMALLSFNICHAMPGEDLEYQVDGGYLYYHAATQSIVFADSAITKVDIPASIGKNKVTGIGRAFISHPQLKSVSIPETIETIDHAAFANCRSLTSITVSGNNPNYCSVDGALLNKSKTELIAVPGALESFTIPETVRTIGSYAFDGCDALTEISIPESVTSIGDDTFADCGSLSKMTIPSHVTSVGESAFAKCTSLKELTIENGLTSIGPSAFFNCASLESITIPESVTAIGEDAFLECTALKSINVESGNTKYSSADGALFNKDQTELVSVPNGLSEYTVPSSVRTIGTGAFSACKKLTQIIIPEGVTAIADNAFLDCAGLKSITIPESVVSIGPSAFKGCSTDNLVFTVKQGSFADSWAAGQGFKVSYNGSAAENNTAPEETPAAAGTPAASGISSEVKVAIGSNIITIGDKTYETDAAPYIQKTSSSTLVPLRFVSLAVAGGSLDNADSSDIVNWDAATKTATVTAGNKVVKFTSGSNTMILGNESVSMNNGVVAEITNGRMYVPFRALGEALGVEVDWNQETKEAIYKAG